MYHELPNLWKDLLLTGLKEDGWFWDWTSLGTRKNPNQKLKARVIAKSQGIWAAADLARCLGQMSSSVQVESKWNDGQQFTAGATLVEIEGLAREVLALERPFLNLAAYVSGIATTTFEVVEKVRSACPKRPPRVTLTRKTMPGYRDICIHGVRVGGGFPHRVSLSGGVLIKENHIAAAGSIGAAIQGSRHVAPHGLKIEVEVTSEEELKQALQARADGVLLDNFNPTQVQHALKLIQESGNSIIVEVSGGIHLGNIQDYAIEGVDVISMGALTHSFKTVDLSLLVYE